MDRKDFKRQMQEVVASAADVIEKECMAVFDKMTNDEKDKLNHGFAMTGGLLYVTMYYLAKNVLTSIDVNELLRRQFHAESMDDRKRLMQKVIRRQA